MRIALPLLALLAAACSTTECARCKERHAAGHFAVAIFEDTDDDGLPARRYRRILRDARDHEESLERALVELEQAIERVRRAMR